MALQLTKEVASGASGNYWRVVEVQLDYASRSALVVVSLYKDATARTNGKAIMDVASYTWAGTEFDDLFDDAVLDPAGKNPQERAYVKLKTLPEFDGAVDV